MLPDHNPRKKPLRLMDIGPAVFAQIRGHAEAFVLFVVLWAVLSTIVASPMMADLALWQKTMETDQEAGMAMLSDLAPKLIVQSGVSLFLAVIIPVLWSRLLLMGRGMVLSKGLLAAYGKALIRTAALLGYQFLVVIGLLIASILVMAVAGLLGLGEGAASTLMVMLVVAGMLPVYLAYCLSVVAVSVGAADGGIAGSFKRMKAYWKPYVALSVIVPLGLSLLGGVISIPLIGEDGTPGRLALLVGAVFNGISLLFIFTAAVVLHRHDHADPLAD
ncbi:hypothetical protein AQ1_01894 [alpha proteobacterium Q-1]|nr:hypothetical protein AQ1_01894 [alpha proteobacterium Q-1]